MFAQGFDGDADVDHPEEAHEKAVLEDELLDELDFDSDSGPEFFDNISVQSTPRPHLRYIQRISILLLPVLEQRSTQLETCCDDYLFYLPCVYYSLQVQYIDFSQ